MSSTFSPNLAIELIGTGDQAGTWGITTDRNLGTLIEQAISGYVSQAITDGADTVITIPNGATGVARNMYIVCTGTLTANRNLIVPPNNKLYFVSNQTTGGFSVTVKVSGQTGVSVPNGAKTALVCNGIDITDATNYLTNLTLGGSISAAAFVPTGSTIPANGLFLPSANTIGLSSNTTLRWSVNSTGNHTISAPTSGNALTVGGSAGASALAISYASGGAVSLVANVTAGNTNTWRIGQTGVVNWDFVNTATTGVLNLYNGIYNVVSFGTSGTVTINAPPSGTTLVVQGTSGLNDIILGSTGAAAGMGMGWAVGLAVGAWNIYSQSTDPMIIGTAGATSLGFVTNSLTRMSLSSAGNVSIAAPTSGIALDVSAAASTNAIVARGVAGQIGLWATAPAGVQAGIQINQAGQTVWQLYQPASGNDLRFYNSNTAVDQIKITNAGNVTINPPSSGSTLTVAQGTLGVGGVAGVLITASAANLAQLIIAGNNATPGTTSADFIQNSANDLLIVNRASANIYLYTSNSQRVGIASAGNVTVFTPGGGVALTVNGVSGTHSSKIADSATNLFNAGFLELPLNTQNANYTTVLADSSKAIYHSDGTARTYTIDSNANVAYPVGTTLTFVNDASAAVNVTIAITSDTLVLSPGGSTGSRTLAQYGRATAHKVGTTRWVISGSGLT